MRAYGDAPTPGPVRSPCPLARRLAPWIAVVIAGAGVVVVGVRAARSTRFAGSALRCVPVDEVDAPPAPDGSFAVGGLRYAPPRALAPLAAMLDLSRDGAAQDPLEVAAALSNQIGARVPHQLAYGNEDDPARPEFNPERALEVRRSEERAGTCATRAGLLVLELWRRGHPARVAQMTYANGHGHVTAEVWSPRHGSWVAVDPSMGAQLLVDGRPAALSRRMVGLERYEWARIGPEAPSFPAFHPHGSLRERIPVAQIAWPEPWLLSRKGERAETWWRSTFAIAAIDGDAPCDRLSAARGAIAAGLLAIIVGAAGAAISLLRRRGGASG